MQVLIQIHGKWTKENKPDYINKAGTKTGEVQNPHEYGNMGEAEEAAIKLMKKLGGSDYTIDPA